MEQWLSVKDNPPEIGQPIIGMNIMPYMISPLVAMEDGYWHFVNYDHNPLYIANVQPEWWIPMPECTERWYPNFGKRIKKIKK